MTDRKVGPLALALMHFFEQCLLTAYLCPAGVWTIGWGSTYYINGGRVKRGDKLTQVQADQLFAGALARDFAAAVDRAIGAVATTPGQFGAMVALAYNIGVANFRASTVLKKHLAGDHAGAAAAFASWNKARVGGELKVLAGLVKRRAAEAALYRGDTAELARITAGRVA